MVRVGGGWCALDEFLVKNDPCRAKGRTNVELREQFTLASGVSQSMTPFKSKAPRESPTSSVSGDTRNGSMQGPITKIKEKSERSLGMNVRSSVDYGQDDYGRRSSGMGRNSLTPGSGPNSRPGSRAPSHHGSNVSLNSEDDGRRGSGVRRTSSMRSGSRGLRPTPMGFGSQVPRKTSTPGDRKRTDSNSSTDRTPLAARVRSKSYITPRPSKMIKSTSESNIPVFVGCHSTNTPTTSTPTRLSASSREETKRKRSLIPRPVGRPATGTASTAGSISEPAAESGASELLGLSEESLEQQPVFEEEEQGESLEETPAAPSPSDTV